MSLASSNKSIGLWSCDNVPLLNEKGQLKPLTAEETFATQGLEQPDPVDCDQGQCRCEAAAEDHTFVRLVWPSRLVGKRADAAGFVVHFGINETDAEEVFKASKV